MVQLLFAEDELSLGQLVKDALEGESDFAVTWVTEGDKVLEAFERLRPQACILDVMLPQVDGFTLAKEIRSRDEQVPILFLTARSQTVDVVKGFELGGNDYLKKPFSVAELIVRIRALLRRSAGTGDGKGEDVFTLGAYEFIPDKHILRYGATRYNLTHRETELLRKLVMNKNQLTDRKEVLMELWGDESFFHARTMDVYIAKLRKYLSQDVKLSIINIRGFGYKLIEEV